MKAWRRNNQRGVSENRGIERKKAAKSAGEMAAKNNGVGAAAWRKCMAKA
jgi:hypothetical protein